MPRLLVVPPLQPIQSAGQSLYPRLAVGCRLCGPGIVIGGTIFGLRTKPLETLANAIGLLPRFLVVAPLQPVQPARQPLDPRLAVGCRLSGPGIVIGIRGIIGVIRSGLVTGLRPQALQTLTDSLCLLPRLLVVAPLQPIQPTRQPLDPRLAVGCRPFGSGIVIGICGIIGVIRSGLVTGLRLQALQTLADSLCLLPRLLVVALLQPVQSARQPLDPCRTVSRRPFGAGCLRIIRFIGLGRVLVHRIPGRVRHGIVGIGIVCSGIILCWIVTGRPVAEAFDAASDPFGALP